MILDSSFLIDLEWEHEPALEKAREIEEAGLARRVPLVVVSELYIGVGKGTRMAENRRTMDRVLRGLSIVEATLPIARRAGTLEGERQAGGEGIGLVDALIASIALEYDEPVVTADPGDFERIDGVAVETY